MSEDGDSDANPDVDEGYAQDDMPVRSTPSPQPGEKRRRASSVDSVHLCVKTLKSSKSSRPKQGDYDDLEIKQHIKVACAIYRGLVGTRIGFPTAQQVPLLVREAWEEAGERLSLDLPLKAQYAKIVSFAFSFIELVI
jgi:hypothetical protein